MAGEQHGLRPIDGTELAQDGGHVGLHGRLRDLHVVSDLLVEHAGTQHAEDSELLRSELRHALCHIERRAVDHRLGRRAKSGRVHHLATQHGQDVAAYGGGVDALGNEALRAERESLAHDVRIIHGRDDDDGQLRAGAAQVRQGAEAVRTGQIQIEEQQIGARMKFQRVEQPCDALGLEGLALRTCRGNGAAQRVAIQRVIIDDENFVFDVSVSYDFGRKSPRAPRVYYRPRLISLFRDTTRTRTIAQELGRTK